MERKKYERKVVEEEEEKRKGEKEKGGGVDPSGARVDLLFHQGIPLPSCWPDPLCSGVELDVREPLVRGGNGESMLGGFGWVAEETVERN